MPSSLAVATISVLSKLDVKQATLTWESVLKLKDLLAASINAGELSGKVDASSLLKPGMTKSTPMDSAKLAAIFRKTPLRLGTHTALADLRAALISSIFFNCGRFFPVLTKAV